MNILKDSRGNHIGMRGFGGRQPHHVLPDNDGVSYKEGQLESWDSRVDARNLSSSEWVAALRLICIYVYSDGTNKCKRCGEHDIDVLTLDHVNNDGAEHRREIKASCKTRNNIFEWLFYKDFPDYPPLQVLCRNCNWKKHIDNLKSNSGPNGIRSKEGEKRIKDALTNIFQVL
jgi:hypothetical protein